MPEQQEQQEQEQQQEQQDQTEQEQEQEQEHEQEPETFTREYVEQLRTEAAEGRVKAKRATELETALRDAVISKVAGSILQDPSTLEWSDDLADDDGMPNPEAIKEAAETLATAKPHLSRIRGEILQGHRGNDSDAGSVDLAGMLRAGA